MNKRIYNTGEHYGVDCGMNRWWLDEHGENSHTWTRCAEWPPPAPGTHESDLDGTWNGRTPSSYVRFSVGSFHQWMTCADWSRSQRGLQTYSEEMRP